MAAARTAEPWSRFGRYLSVGAICALANNAIMIGGGVLHVYYALSFALAYVLVTPLGYILHVRHTFGADASWRGLARFGAANFTGTLISFALMALFISGFGLPAQIASPVVTLILFFWNYAAAHWAILAASARSRRV